MTTGWRVMWMATALLTVVGTSAAARHGVTAPPLALRGAGDEPITARSIACPLPGDRDPGYENGNPAFSPDGTAVVFEGLRDGNRDVFLASADGSGARRVASDPATEMHPSWTPDGRILFDSDRTGDPELYVMSRDGSGVTRLTDHPALDLVPLASPDGRWIAFNSTRSGDWDVYRMPITGGEVENLTESPGTDITRSWSRDGLRIHFDSDRDGNPAGGREAYTMAPDGSDVRRLTWNDADDRFLRPGPPGTSLIAFMSTRGTGGRGIWLMEQDGSNVRPLYDGPCADFFPTWSPDGSTVVFYSEEAGYGDLYLMRADGSGRRRFLDDDGPS